MSANTMPEYNRIVLGITNVWPSPIASFSVHLNVEETRALVGLLETALEEISNNQLVNGGVK